MQRIAVSATDSRQAELTAPLRAADAGGTASSVCVCGRRVRE